MSVALGREQDKTTLRKRVDRLVGIYPQLVTRLEGIDTVDMRYQNGLALHSAALALPADPSKPMKPPKAAKAGKPAAKKNTAKNTARTT